MRDLDPFAFAHDPPAENHHPLHPARDAPLDESTLRYLRYMHDVEHHTVCYLRDLLVTRAHHDPTITTFLTFWAYEEYWHGEAIGKVLHAHGEQAGRAERCGLSAERTRWVPASCRRPRSDIWSGCCSTTPTAAAARIDRRIDRLPGLAGLGLITAGVDRYANAA